MVQVGASALVKGQACCARGYQPPSPTPPPDPPAGSMQNPNEEIDRVLSEYKRTITADLHTVVKIVEHMRDPESGLEGGGPEGGGQLPDEANARKSDGREEGGLN